MPRTLQAKTIIGRDHKAHIDLDIPADYPEGEVVLSIILPEQNASGTLRFGDFLKTAPFDDDFIVERDPSLPREVDL